MRENIRKALQLCVLALVNYVLFYGIGVFLARALGVGGFKTYSVAIATLTLLASLSTLGLEKYAVRVLPAYFDDRDWGHARGYTFFARDAVVCVACALAALFGLITAAKYFVFGTPPIWSTLLALLFLPVMVLALLMLEVMASGGEVVRPTLVYRLLFPLCFATALIAIRVAPVEITPVLAVASYGTAWIVVFLVLRTGARRSLPGEIRTVAAVREPGCWIRKSVPFLIHSVMMTQFASIGVVGLELLGTGEREVAVFAAAMQTGAFIVLLATATNRLYGPMASRLIERHDYPGLLAAIRERHTWIVPTTLLYFVAVVLFGRRILGLFGPEYDDGYAALCWIAGGASVSVWFAMAPSYLKFVGRNGTVLGITAAGGGLNVVLLLALGPRFGATGAGAAYGISLGTMAVALLVLGLRTAAEVSRN